MSYENIIDMHTHSNISFDGNNTCLEMCEGAIKNGGIGIAITDHLEADDDSLDTDDFTKKQISDLIDAKIDIKGKIALLNGLELGQAIYRKEKCEKLLDTFHYDFVLGSIHNLENM